MTRRGWQYVDMNDTFTGSTTIDPHGWAAVLALPGSLAAAVRMFDRYGDTLTIDGDALRTSIHGAGER